MQKKNGEKMEPGPARLGKKIDRLVEYSSMTGGVTGLSESLLESHFSKFPISRIELL